MLLNKDEIVNAITQTLPISKQTQQIIDYLYSEEEAEKEKENILSNNITSYLLDYFQVHSLQKEFPFELDEIESDCFSPSKSIDDGEKENIVILKNPHDFENSIGEKIESILIDIYNSHISHNTKYDELLLKYEQNFDLLCEGFLEIPNLKILQILLGKIKKILEAYKTLLFQKTEIKRIRQSYLKMIEKKLIVLKSKEIKKEIEPNSENNNICNALLLPTYQIEDCDNTHNNKSIIIHFLNDLYYIKNALLSAGADIERIFKHSLTFLKDNNKIVQFDFEKVHIEEFSKNILFDDFISVLLLEIKKKKLEGIIPMLHYIEDNPLNPAIEATRMNEFIAQRINHIHKIKRIHRSQLIDEMHNKINQEQNLLFDRVSKTSNVEIDSNSTKVDPDKVKQTEQVKPIEQKKFNPKPILAKKTKLNNETKELDIDQLVNYILQNDKSGKKSKKKKNKKSKTNNADINNATIEERPQKEEGDKEIESVKKSIKNDSCNKYSIRKIQPHISQDWINSITVSI